MKKLALALMLLILLTACGQKEGESSEDIRDYYRSLEHIEMTVTQRTDFGDRVLDFEVLYKWQKDGACTIETLSPQAIRGLTATLRDDGATLAFDQTIVELGALPGTGLSPLEALPLMIGQWSDGYVSSSGREKLAEQPCLRYTYKTTWNETALEQTVWFAQDSRAPVLAELAADGQVIVRCTFSGVNLT